MKDLARFDPAARLTSIARRRTVFYTRDWGELLRISLGRVQGGNDGPQIGIEHNRGALQRFCLAARPAAFVRRPREKSPRWNLMVKSGSLSRWPVRISTTDSPGLTNPLWRSFLSPASVTAEAGSQPMPSAPISALAVGDFDFRHLFDLAASCLQHAQRFLPRCRIADAVWRSPACRQSSASASSRQILARSGRTDSRLAPE